MQQPQTRRSLSVGTRLLLTIGVLLLVVVIFLNLSALFLVGDDKRAYVYESQSKEVTLVGRDFVGKALRSIDFVRLALASVDPTNGVDEREKSSFKALVENQNELILVGLYRISMEDRTVNRLTQHIPSGATAQGAKFDSGEGAGLSYELVQATLPTLTSRGFAVFNQSRLGGEPAIGILLADKNQLTPQARTIDVAFGIKTLTDFAQSAQGMNLSIVSASGDLLFDSDSGRLFSGESLREDPLLINANGVRANQGATEYEDSERRYLGSWLKPGLDLVVMTRTDRAKAFRAIYELTEKFVLLGLIAIGVGIILAIVFAKSLTRPLAKLSQATSQIAQGNFDLNLPVESGDEIGGLTASFNTMSKQIVELISAQVEKSKLEAELEIASTVQKNLIPPADFRNPNVYLHSTYKSASQCGGDWWGFFGVDDKIAVMIADATGHGFPSALITASARSCFSVLHKLALEDPDFSFSPSAMLSYANRVVFEASGGSIMMTFFIAVLDFKTGVMTYSSAAHNPPWLFRKEGSAFKLNSLITLGQRLGEAREVDSFEEKSIEFGAGDILFMYTDGLIEGKNLAGDMFGKKRMRKIVESQLSVGPEKVVSDLMTEFMEYNTGKELDDDVTIAMAQILNVGGGSA